MDIPKRIGRILLSKAGQKAPANLLLFVPIVGGVASVAADIAIITNSAITVVECAKKAHSLLNQDKKHHRRHSRRRCRKRSPHRKGRSR